MTDEQFLSLLKQFETDEVPGYGKCILFGKIANKLKSGYYTTDGIEAEIRRLDAEGRLEAVPDDFSGGILGVKLTEL